MVENVTFWALVALAVGVFGWGLAQLILGLVRPETDRLEERLAADMGKETPAGPGRQAIQKQARDLPLSAGSSWLRRLDNHLRQVSPHLTAAGFLGLVGVLGIGAFALVGWLHSVVAGLLAGLGGGAIPLLVLNTQLAKRQRILADQLMDALDFLSRVLRAGHSLVTGFQMIGEELPEPIASEFRRCYDQNSLGQSLEQAMMEMAERVDSTDFAFFVTSVIIQRQTGGDLATLLDNISDVVRKRIRLQQHTKALTAEGRATGYILTALPPVVFFLLYLRNPDYEGMLLYTDTGRMLLIGMACLQIIGLALIKKIVTVKV